MYTNVSEAFVQKITSSSRTFRAKLVFNNHEISDGIYKIKTKGGSCPDTNLKVGSAMAATADIEIEETNYPFKNKEFELHIGLMLDDDSIEYVPYGKYTVRSSNTKDKKTSLSVADRMYLADKTYKTNLTFPTTAEQVVAEIGATLGVPYDITGLEDIIIPFAPSTRATMREALGKVAALAGCNAMFDRFGTLVFKWYEESGYVTDYDYIENPEIDEEDFTINYLMCQITDTVTETYGNEKAIQGMSISNEFAMTETLLKVWDKIKNFSYRPVSVKMLLGDIRLDPWDIFTINMDGPKVSTIAMNIDFEFDGGLLCAVSATAPNTDSGYLTPAQIAAQKQAEKEKNSTLVLTAANDKECNVSTAETMLLGLQFTTQQESLPFINATVQLDETASGVITVLLKINGSTHSAYRISTAEGYNLMSFSAAFTDLAGGSNQLNLYITGTKDGMAIVQPKQANIILTGYGLIAQAAWDGNIILNEVIKEIVAHVNSMSVQKFKSSIEISTIVPIPIAIEDTISEPVCSVNEMEIRQLSDAIPYRITGISNVDNETIEILFSNMLMLSEEGINVDSLTFKGYLGAELADIPIYAAALERIDEEEAFSFSNKLILKVDDLSQYEEQIGYTIVGGTGLIDPFTNEAIELLENGAFNRGIFEGSD